MVNQKKMYLAGSVNNLILKTKESDFIKTQIVDQATAENLSTSIELVFEEGKLVEVFGIDDKGKKARELKDYEKCLAYEELEPHQIYTLDQDRNGNSYLGGRPPKSFVMPSFDFKAPFQYFGRLSTEDEPFSWLPFDLRLVAPIYNNFEHLFLDYSNPEAPQVVNVDDLKLAEPSLNDLLVDAQVMFARVPMKLVKTNNYDFHFGHTGVPNWIQAPEIPHCPITGNTMKFVCQLGGMARIPTVWKNFTSSEYSSAYESLNFWSDGDLFIFFEPESKVVCYLIQIT